MSNPLIGSQSSGVKPSHFGRKSTLGHLLHLAVPKVCVRGGPGDAAQPDQCSQAIDKSQLVKDSQNACFDRHRHRHRWYPAGYPTKEGGVRLRPARGWQGYSTRIPAHYAVQKRRMLSWATLLELLRRCLWLWYLRCGQNFAFVRKRSSSSREDSTPPPPCGESLTRAVEVGL